MVKDMKEKLAIGVIGYDPYIDVWNHYFELLNKYWPDRPRTYLISNEILPEYEGVTVYSAGKDAEWSKKVQVALEKVDAEYIVLLLEDFFTTRTVRTDAVLKLVQEIDDSGIKYCKLLNQSRIKGKRFRGNKHLHVISRDEEYGISLQPAIWHRAFLQELVGTENYNAWIFEFKQVKNKAWNLEGIDSVADDSNVLEITHAVVQSKYLPKAVKVFKKQKYLLDTNARAVLSKKENFKYRLKGFVKEYSPKCMTGFLKKIGRMMKVDFVSDRQIGGTK